MSTMALEGLLSYLYGTLSPSNMRWVGEHLIEYAKKEQDEQLRPYTMQEIDDMLDEAEAAFEAGDILTELSWKGHHGKMFSTSEIGKAMKRMGFNSRKSHGTTKYLVIKIDPSTRKQECIDDAQEFIPDHF